MLENDFQAQIPDQSNKQKCRLFATVDSNSTATQTLKLGEADKHNWWSIKRKIANDPKIEIYEEEISDEIFEEKKEGEVDLRQILNSRVCKTYYVYLDAFVLSYHCIVENCSHCGTNLLIAKKFSQI